MHLTSASPLSTQSRARLLLTGSHSRDKSFVCRGVCSARHDHMFGRAPGSCSGPASFTALFRQQLPQPLRKVASATGCCFGHSRFPSGKFRHLLVGSFWQLVHRLSHSPRQPGYGTRCRCSFRRRRIAGRTRCCVPSPRSASADRSACTRRAAAPSRRRGARHRG